MTTRRLDTLLAEDVLVRLTVQAQRAPGMQPVHRVTLVLQAIKVPVLRHPTEETVQRP